jgi:hypothetical protein
MEKAPKAPNLFLLKSYRKKIRYFDEKKKRKERNKDTYKKKKRKKEKNF